MLKDLEAEMIQVLMEYLREYDTPAPDLALRSLYREKMKKLMTEYKAKLKEKKS
jgi:hypothetical protein